MATHRLEFRASDAREANKWIKGINSVVSQFGFEGVRPSRQERQQIVNGLAPGHRTSLELKHFQNAEQYVMTELNLLKGSIFRATEPSGEDGEGDPTAMVEINIILQEQPNLMVEVVKAVKARIKDKNQRVQIIALDLLDQCLQSNGIQLQMHVMKKVLPLVLKFAKGECRRACQQKAASLIKSWATRYGVDRRMKDYDMANRELVRASMSTAAAGDGNGQYIHTTPAAVHMPVSTAQMSQEVKDLIQSHVRLPAFCVPIVIQSLKLAAQLTKEDLKKVQDVNTLPTFDPDATAGLGQHPLFLQCPRHN
jgi:hypothetical protein